MAHILAARFSRRSNLCRAPFKDSILNLSRSDLEFLAYAVLQNCLGPLPAFEGCKRSLSHALTAGEVTTLRAIFEAVDIGGDHGG